MDHENISGAAALAPPVEMDLHQKVERRLAEHAVRRLTLYVPESLYLEIGVWARKRRKSVSEIGAKLLRRACPVFDLTGHRLSDLEERALAG